MDQQRIYTLILTVPCIVIPETQFICHPPTCYSPELFIEETGGSIFLQLASPPFHPDAEARLVGCERWQDVR